MVYFPVAGVFSSQILPFCVEGAIGVVGFPGSCFFALLRIPALFLEVAIGIEGLVGAGDLSLVITAADHDVAVGVVTFEGAMELALFIKADSLQVAGFFIIHPEGIAKTAIDFGSPVIQAAVVVILFPGAMGLALLGLVFSVTGAIGVPDLYPALLDAIVIVGEGFEGIVLVEGFKGTLQLAVLVAAFLFDVAVFVVNLVRPVASALFKGQFFLEFTCWIIQVPEAVGAALAEESALARAAVGMVVSVGAIFDRIAGGDLQGKDFLEVAVGVISFKRVGFLSQAGTGCPINTQQQQR